MQRLTLLFWFLALNVGRAQPAATDAPELTREGSEEASDSTAPTPEPEPTAEPAAPEEPAEPPSPPPTATPDEPPAPAPTRVWSETLPNGLRVVGRQIFGRSFSALCVSYRVGHADDPEDYTGLAHLTEHLMFAPQARMANGFHGLLEPTGATYINAFTSDDETRYCTELPDAALGLALYGEGERMAYLLEGLSEDAVATQRRVVINESDERSFAREGPVARIRRLPLEELYPDDHPMWRGRRPEEDVEALELQHIQWFHQTYYTPANAVVAIVSPRPQEEIMPLVERFLGHVRGGDAPERAELVGPRALTEGVDIDYRSGLTIPRLILTWPSPAYYAEGDAELDYIAVHLRKRLRDELPSPDVMSVSVRQESHERGSQFQIQLSGSRETAMKPFLEIIDRELGALQRELLDESEVESLRRRVRGFVARSSLGRAGRLVRTFSMLGEPRSSEDEQERYDAVTRESIRDAARTILSLDRRIVLNARHSEAALGDGIARISRGN